MKRIVVTSLLWLVCGIAYALDVGDRVEANGTVNVRATPAGSIEGTQRAGREGIIVRGPRQASLGGVSYTWWEVNWDSGADGWVADIGLTFVSASARTPVINSISPRTMDADGTSRSLRIDGSGFQSGNIVQFRWSAGAGANVWTTSSSSPSITSSRITVSMNPGRVNDTIQVRVCTNSGATSCASSPHPITVSAAQQVAATGKRTATWPATWINPVTRELGGNVLVSANFGALSLGCSNASYREGHSYEWYEPRLGSDGFVNYSAHIGVDISLDNDKPVYAIADGTVLESNEAWTEFWGDIVRVQHYADDGSAFVVTYAHLNSSVNPGDIVVARMKLGSVSTHNHLHLGLRTGTSAETQGMIGDARIDGTESCDLSGNSLNMIDALSWLSGTSPGSSDSKVSLSINKDGSGEGSVASNPAGINCGSTCMFSFAGGTDITLSAYPASGSTFTGWTGDCNGYSTCQIRITSAARVTANFTAATSGNSETPNSNANRATTSNGSASSAQFSIASFKGSVPSYFFNPGETATILGTIKPQASDIGRPGEIYLVIRTTTATRDTWAYRDLNGGLQSWNSILRDLQPAYEINQLRSSDVFEIYSGPLVPALHRIYIGYSVRGGILHFTPTALQLDVRN